MTTDKYYSVQCSSCYNNADNVCLECDIPLCSICVTNECMNCYYQKYRSIQSSSISENMSCKLVDNNYTFYILIVILIILILL